MHNMNICFMTSEDVKQLLFQYNDKLIEAKVSMRRSELKQKDFVDVRNICTYERTAEITDMKSRLPDVNMGQIQNKFLKQMYWYCYIPCFNEGVYQLNDARYIYWKIKEINVTKQHMEIFVCDYMRNYGIWQMGVNANATWDFTEKPEQFSIDSHNHVEIKLKDYQLFSQIYQIISYDIMHWNEMERAIWQKYVIQNAKVQEDSLNEKHHTNNAAELVKLFTYFTLIINEELYFNKPKAIRKNKTDAKKTIIVEENKAPKKITRMVGNIKMESVKIPKCPTKESVVHYKTAIWKARGGVRRMKNGKVIPFKESIRHRKCLQNNEKQEIPQTTLRFRKKTD